MSALRTEILATLLEILSDLPPQTKILAKPLVQEQRQDFGLGGGGHRTKISYMISSQVLYCNGVAIISVRENIQQK